jgi:hypothetical protein
MTSRSSIMGKQQETFLSSTMSRPTLSPNFHSTEVKKNIINIAFVRKYGNRSDYIETINDI